MNNKVCIPKRFLTIGEPLGEGGNGKVFKVLDENTGIECALKVLKTRKDKYYDKKVQRFKDEVKIVFENQNKMAGILPILDYSIEVEYWYTMQLATPIDKHLLKLDKSNNIEYVIKCISSLAKSLEALHEKEIVHRDIKPNNIYYHNGDYCLGDFGLVDFKDKKGITQVKESVGAKDTIAPEMKRNAFSADGKKADVYSLAKTLWILLTENNASFDGQYIVNDKTIGIANYCKKNHLIELEDLLTKCTDNTPDNRPTMHEFYLLLNEWWDIKNNYEKAHISQWNHIQKQLFGKCKPSRMELTDIDEIVKTLKLVSSYNQLNHMFMPDGGGLDLDYVEKAGEKNCVVLIGNGVISIVKPKVLCYENIANDPMWSYFKIDFDSLDPIEESYSDTYYENLTEVTPGVYDTWLSGNYGFDEQGNPLPSGYRIIDRYLHGSIVLFSKASVYNDISGTYDGRHDKFESQRFRKYIEDMRQSWIKVCELDIVENFYGVYNKDPFNTYKTHKTDSNYKQKMIMEKQIKEIVRNYIEFIDLKQECTQLGQLYPIKCSARYNLALSCESIHTVGSAVTQYDLDSNLHFRKVENDRWVSGCCIENPYEFINFNQVKFVKEKIVHILTKKCEEENLGWKDVISFHIKLKRVDKPQHLFTKKEIEDVLRSGNDHINNTLVIDVEGYVHLVPSNDIDLSQFAVTHEGYCAYNNYVGKYSSLSNLEDVYISFLEAWKEHLRRKCQVSKDYTEYKYSEKELILKIKELTDKNANDYKI